MHKTKSKNLGKQFQFWKSLPEVRAQPCTREQLIAPSVFYLRPGAGEFLWLKKHVGQRSDKARKQPNCHAGRRLREPPLARLTRCIFRIVVSRFIDIHPLLPLQW